MGDFLPGLFYGDKHGAGFPAGVVIHQQTVRLLGKPYQVRMRSPVTIQSLVRLDVVAALGNAVLDPSKD